MLQKKNKSKYWIHKSYKKICIFFKKYKFDTIYFSNYYYYIVNKLVKKTKKKKKYMPIFLLKFFLSFKFNNYYNLRALTNWKLSILMPLLHRYLSPIGSMRILYWYKKIKNKKVSFTKVLPQALSFKKKYRLSSLWFSLEVLQNSTSFFFKSLKLELFKLFTFKSKSFLTKFRFHKEIKNIKINKAWLPLSVYQEENFNNLVDFNRELKLKYNKFYSTSLSTKQANAILKSRLANTKKLKWIRKLREEEKKKSEGEKVLVFINGLKHLVYKRGLERPKYLNLKKKNTLKSKKKSIKNINSKNYNKK